MLNLIFLFLHLSFAWSASTIQVECDLFDEEGILIKSFPGALCHFLDNGDRVVVGRNFDFISYINSKDQVIWKKAGTFHHQLKVDYEKREIATLTETIHDVLGCKTRFDSITVFDLKTGRIKQTVDIYNLYQKKLINPSEGQVFLTKIRSIQPRAACDTTHVNSLAQIPENPVAKKIPAFAAGNWLVSLTFTGNVLIFDRDFKKIIWQKKIDLRDPNYHDIQLTNDGKILLYVNHYNDKNNDDYRNLFSVIAFVDPLKSGESSLEIYEIKNKGQRFFQPLVGGIQLLPDNMKLTSIYDSTDGFQVAFVDKNWNVSKTFKPRALGNVGQIFQEARFVDASKFFKNYSGQ